MKIDNESVIDLSVKDNLINSGTKVSTSQSKPENTKKNIEENNKNTSDLNSNSDKDIKVLDRLLKFDVIEKENLNGTTTKKIVVSVVDEETGEVLRKVPAEELKAEFDNLSKFVGILFDKLG